jgi:hypothetical protein
MMKTREGVEHPICPNAVLPDDYARARSLKLKLKMIRGAGRSMPVNFRREGPSHESWLKKAPI